MAKTFFILFICKPLTINHLTTANILVDYHITKFIFYGDLHTYTFAAHQITYI